MNPPPLNSHDHPDFPSMKWTNLEMDAIKAYGEACIAAYKASVSKRQSHRMFDSPQVHAIRRLALQGYNYKIINKEYPMSEVTFINIIKRRGAYK